MGDFARERLGLSARELQSLARVASRLDQLPRVAAAFEAGEIGWSQCRLLVSVATEETESDWLARARERTVRALERLVCEVNREAVDHISEEDGKTVEGEMKLRFRMSCSRSVKTLWRKMLGLARQVAGEELPAWRAAEFIAAEALSGRGPHSDEESDRPECPEAPSAMVDRSGERDEPPLQGEAYPGLDWSAVAVAAPYDVELLAEDSDRLDTFELDERLREAVRALQQIDWQAGRLLAVAAHRRLHRLLGFESMARYVEERLGLSARKARALIALERRSFEVPGLAEAYREGRISWARALAVMSAPDDHGTGAWVERAEQVTLRKLNDEIEEAIERAEAPAVGPEVELEEEKEAIERQSCAVFHSELKEIRPFKLASTEAEIVFSGPMSVVFLFRKAVNAHAAPGEHKSMGLERVLRHAQAEWLAQPKHRDPISRATGGVAQCRPVPPDAPSTIITFDSGPEAGTTLRTTGLQHAKSTISTAFMRGGCARSGARPTRSCGSSGYGRTVRRSCASRGDVYLANGESRLAADEGRRFF